MQNLTKTLTKVGLGTAGFVLCVLGLLNTTHGLPAYADVSSAPWLASGTLPVEKLFDLGASQTAPFANQDCHNYTYRADDNTSVTKCFVDTAFGAMERDGNGNATTILYNGASYGGNTTNFSSSYFGPYPIPNSSTVVHYINAGAPQGLFIKFTTGVPRQVTQTIDTAGKRSYKFNQAPDLGLTDKAGHNIYVNSNIAVSPSANGSWLVVDYPFKSLLRVNLATFDVLPFANSLSVNGNALPAAQTAISNDGRYVVIANGGGMFRLYDLSTCTGTVPDTISGPLATCQSKNLLTNFPSTSYGTIKAITNIRFINDNTISFYMVYNYDSSHTPNTFNTSKFTISAPGTPASSLQYLGMGDSFSAGEGSFSYISSTDTDDNKCHQSTLSYPYVLGVLFNSGYKSIACSGAKLSDIDSKTDDYLGESGVVTDLVKRRLRTNADDILNNFKPGYISQYEFVLNNRPQIITLTGGGNDIDFSGIVTTCALSPDTCYESYQDREELLLRINRIYPGLVGTYQKLKANAAAGAKIYVVGYPEIAKSGGNCGLNVRLNAGEVDFSNLLIDYLDSVLQKAAASAGVKYVDTSQALYGHRLCEAQPGSAAVNGLTAGNDIHTVIGNESYHPNALGQQILAEVIRTATNNLTTTMPDEDSTLTPPPLQASQLGTPAILTNIPSVPRTLNQVTSDNNLLKDLIIRGSATPISASGSTDGIKPSTAYSVEIHSTPVSLGTFTSDASGDLNFNAIIPSTIAAGYHTIHIYGTGLSGEPIDIYKSIYVAASSSDFDGDGVSNTNSNCVSSSGVDADGDGIDDACDSDVEPAATVQTVILTPSVGASPSAQIISLIITTDPLTTTPTASVTLGQTPTTSISLAAIPLQNNTLLDSHQVLADVTQTVVAKPILAPTNLPPQKTTHLKPLTIGLGVGSLAIVIAILFAVFVL